MKKIILMVIFITHTLLSNELDIKFDSNSYQVDEINKIKLDNYTDFLFTNPQLSVIVQGHTDAIGTKKDNLILSKHRAQAVKKYFVSEGILESRVKIKAYGELKPLTPNDIEAHRKFNRRVDFKTFLTFE